MGATSKVLAVAVIGLTVVGCGLTRQAGREVAQRAADDSRCRSYGFKTDGDLARCRMQLDLARLRRRSASGGGTVGVTPDTNSLSLSLLCRDAISRRDSVSMLATCQAVSLADSILDRDRATTLTQSLNWPVNLPKAQPAVRDQVALKLHGVKEIRRLRLPTFSVVVNDDCREELPIANIHIMMRLGARHLNV